MRYAVFNSKHIMEDVQSVEFVTKAVFHSQIYPDELAFFSLQTIKGRTPCEDSFFQLGFTPCKAEQPLQGMELPEKEAQID